MTNNQIALESIKEILSVAMSNIEDLDKVYQSINNLGSGIPSCTSIEAPIDQDNAELYFDVEKKKFFSNMLIEEASSHIKQSSECLEKASNMIRDLYKQFGGDVESFFD